MLVKELIAVLENLGKPNAEVFVNGIEVQGAEVILARIQDGYFGKTATFPDKANKEIVALTKLTEFSDGRVGQTRIMI